jgi:hypothetical protein
VKKDVALMPPQNAVRERHPQSHVLIVNAKKWLEDVGVFGNRERRIGRTDDSQFHLFAPGQLAITDANSNIPVAVDEHLAESQDQAEGFTKATGVNAY